MDQARTTKKIDSKAGKCHLPLMGNRSKKELGGVPTHMRYDYDNTSRFPEARPPHPISYFGAKPLSPNKGSMFRKESNCAV